MYTHFEIDRILDSMTILVDTREQDTPAEGPWTAV